MIGQVISDGYTAISDPKKGKQYKAIIRVNRVPYLSRKNLKTATKAILYGEAWAGRVISIVASRRRRKR